MRKSDQIDKLALAVSKAQRLFVAAERGHMAEIATTKGKYRFNYADLASYLDVCREPLAENELAIFQEPVFDIAKSICRVTTLLVHSSNQFVECDPLELKIEGQAETGKITPQMVGSAITYLRRYALAAIIGLASEDDDAGKASGNGAQTAEEMPVCPACGKRQGVMVSKYDSSKFYCFPGKGGCGNTFEAPGAASEPNQPAKKPEEPPKRGKPPATKTQVSFVRFRIDGMNQKDKTEFTNSMRKRFGTRKSDELTWEEAEQVISELEKTEPFRTAEQKAQQEGELFDYYVSEANKYRGNTSILLELEGEVGDSKVFGPPRKEDLFAVFKVRADK